MFILWLLGPGSVLGDGSGNFLLICERNRDRGGRGRKVGCRIEHVPVGVRHRVLMQNSRILCNRGSEEHEHELERDPAAWVGERKTESDQTERVPRPPRAALRRPSP